MSKMLVTVPSIGDKVVRGQDWEWGDQDKGSKYGIIAGDVQYGWVRVEWINEEGNCIRNNGYRVGAENCYDLYYYDEPTSLTEEFVKAQVKSTAHDLLNLFNKAEKPIPRSFPLAKFKVGDRVKICSMDEDTDGIGYKISLDNDDVSKICGVAGWQGEIKYIQQDLGRRTYYYKLDNLGAGLIAEKCLSLIKSKTQTHEKNTTPSDEVQRPTGTITRAEKRAGTAVQGRRGPTSIVSRRVSYKEVYSFR